MLCALVALVGCNLDFSGLGALDDYAGEVAASGEVASVTCSPTALDLPSREAGQCIAQNAIGTRLSADGTGLVIWRSSTPEIVSVDVVGTIQAEALAGDAWIYAEGTHGSMDSVRVTAH